MKLIENKQFLSEFDALVEKYSEKRYHPVPVKEETGVLKELLDAEKEPFKIEKGKWYMCIKDVIMDTGKVAYIKDNVYFSEEDDYLSDEFGNTRHGWASDYIDYFRPARENEIPHEVKFKVGDWIVNKHGFIMQVTGVNQDDETYDYLFEGESYCVSWKQAKENFHLWSLADAKEGDVCILLPKPGSEHAELIFLFKEIDNRDYVKNAVEFYCCVEEGEFKLAGDYYMGSADRSSNFYRPTTQEQRDLLFQKMKEAGYEWNEETHELKKIQKRWRDDKDALITGYAVLPKCGIEQKNNISKDWLIYPTEALAKSVVAMKDVAQIMANDERFGGVVTNVEWDNYRLCKYCIERTNCEVVCCGEYNDYYFLAFHTEECQRRSFRQDEEYDK